MRYDIFVASTMSDRDRTDILVRRLRALKFKVRHARTRTHTTPTARDIKEATEAATILIIWSKTACDRSDADSEWLHIMADQARARADGLVQASLDKTLPSEPFAKDHRYALAGMGPKRIPNGLLDLIEDLGTRANRSGLRDWLALAPRDTAGKAAWLAAHPDDPMAMAGKPRSARPDTPDHAPQRPQPTPPSSPLAQPAPVTPAPTHSASTATNGDRALLALIFVGIAGLFLASYLSRSTTEPIGVANAGPQFIFECPNGERMMCPIGTLEPTGPIIDDTSE